MGNATGRRPYCIAKAVVFFTEHLHNLQIHWYAVTIRDVFLFILNDRTSQV
jgi:hypothetical protein